MSLQPSWFQLCVLHFSATAVNFIPKVPVPIRPQLPKPPRALFGSNFSVADAIAQLTTTVTQRTHLSEVTQAQSSSMTWYTQRAGRITATRVYDILHTNKVSPAPSLIRDICSDEPSTARSDAMTWGNNHEDDAHADYTAWMTLQHTDIKVSKAGLTLDSTHPILAASPDGIVQCSCCGTGSLKIKCPYKYRGQTVSSYTVARDTCLDENGQLLETHRNYQQVQHQMEVTDTPHCDFVVWLQPGHFLVIRVPRYPLYKTDTVPFLVSFWGEHILPELKTRTLECSAKRKLEPKTAHCSCGQPDDREPMVGCDSMDCPHEWYHYSCVGIGAKPQAKTWYCPACRPKKARKTRY